MTKSLIKVFILLTIFTSCNLHYDNSKTAEILMLWQLMKGKKAAARSALVPASIAGYKVHFKADGTVVQGTATGFVSQWTDETGNGYNATQSTLARQPAFISNDPNLNGKPSLSIDGTDDFLNFNRPVQDDFTIALVFRSTQGSGGSIAWYAGAGLMDAESDGIVNDFGMALNATGNVLVGMGQIGGPDIFYASRSGFNDGIGHIVVWRRDRFGGFSYLYVDGVLQSQAAGNTQSLTANAIVTIGAIDSGYNIFNGRIPEIVIYNTVVSIMDMEGLECYLSKKYAISVSISCL